MSYVSADQLQDYLDGRLDLRRAELVERALSEDPDVSAELERLRDTARVLRSQKPDSKLPAHWIVTLRKMRI
jgi:anti-sigma factor RsiW